MGTKYPTQSRTGYNSSPPADDGSSTEANKVKWATHIDKIGDPLANHADAIDAAMVAFADVDTIAKSGAYTVVADDHMRTIECTGTFTLTLGAASSLGTGFIVTVKNAGAGTITIDGNASETIDGAATLALNAQYESVTLVVNSGAGGWHVAAAHSPYTLGLTSDAQTQITNHLADTTTHGTTGDIVGTSDSQTLTNKTFDADSNTLSNVDNGNVKSGANIDAAKIGTGVVSTTEYNYLNGVTSAIQTQLDAKAPAFKGALVYDAGGQTISTGTNTAINLDSESYDTDTIHDTSTNNSRLTVPSGATRIRLTGRVTFAANSTGWRSLTFYKNGLTTAYAGQPIEYEFSPDASQGTALTVTSPIITVTATDYFEMYVHQTSGGNLGVTGGVGNCWFAMEIIE